MESVAVLGDDTVEFPHTVQFTDGLVPVVRFGFGYQRPEQFLAFPVLFAACLGGEEFLVGRLIGIEPVPNAAGAAEIGDSRFGADSGAGEDNDLFGLGDNIGYSTSPMPNGYPQCFWGAFLLPSEPRE